MISLPKTHIRYNFSSLEEGQSLNDWSFLLVGRDKRNLDQLMDKSLGLLTLEEDSELYTLPAGKISDFNSTWGRLVCTYSKRSEKIITGEIRGKVIIHDPNLRRYGPEDLDKYIQEFRVSNRLKSPLIESSKGIGPRGRQKINYAKRSKK